jgi:hypothetical protein
MRVIPAGEDVRAWGVDPRSCPPRRAAVRHGYVVLYEDGTYSYYLYLSSAEGEVTRRTQETRNCPAPGAPPMPRPLGVWRGDISGNRFGAALFLPD